MQTAAAARMFGVLPVLVLFKNHGPDPAIDGNVFLETILGAEIRVRVRMTDKVVKSADAMDCLEEAASDLRRRGFRPYLVPVGGSLVRGDLDRPLGAIAYLEACRELFDQARAAGVEPDVIVHATGSGGTQAGLVLGAKLLSRRTRVIGISVSDPTGPFAADVLEIAGAAEDALGFRRTVGPDDIEVLDEYIADGYGIINRDVVDAVRLFFRTEGIVLDPVYTAKGMVGLIDLIRRGRFKKSDTVIFVHTGGTPALFPNRADILRFLADGEA
jgi:D-cysteine desulfhydrase/L-cysteate sulfo-lyase